MSLGIRNKYKYYILESQAGEIASKLSKTTEIIAFLPLFKGIIHSKINLELIYNDHAYDQHEFGAKCLLNTKYNLYEESQITRLFNPDGSTEVFTFDDTTNSYVSLETGKKLSVERVNNTIRSAIIIQT